MCIMFMPTARKPGQRFGIPKTGAAFWCFFPLLFAVLRNGLLHNTWGGGVGWGVVTSLNLHTWSLLRWTCTHGRCYGELAHMVDATQHVGWWGGVGCNDILELAHMVDATQHDGVGWVGNDVNVPWTCLHGWCHATWWGGVGGEWC